jgi:hypothetical protein
MPDRVVIEAHGGDLQARVAAAVRAAADR